MDLLGALSYTIKEDRKENAMSKRVFVCGAKFRAGFTLIELLVVVLIIGILSAVALPQYTKAVEKSRSAEAMTILGNLVADEQLYKMANGKFTGNLMDLDRTYPGTPAGATGTNYMDTKNFRISITDPAAVINVGGSAPTFGASAVRAKNGTAYTTGEQAYSLNVAISAAGQITRTCTGSESMCKALGGAACSSNNKDWCYAGSGSSSGGDDSSHTGSGTVD